MAGAAVVGSGTWLLEVQRSTSFILDNVYAGVLNNTTYVLDGSGAYADVTSTVTSLNVKRGRRDVGDQFASGTMSWTMFDPNGDWNPFNTSSPYYAPNGQPGLAPMRYVRLSRYNGTTWDYVFIGVIVNFAYDFGNPGDLNTITVYCADDFYLLSQAQIPDTTPSQELSSARLNTVLDYPSIAYPTGAAARNIATGTQTLGGGGNFKISNGTNFMQYTNAITFAEQGRTYMSRSGVLTFLSRVYANQFGTATADFHDDGTNIPYNELGVSFEADRVINRCTVTIQGSTTHNVAENLTSQNQYFVQALTVDNSLLSDDTAAANLASYLLYPYPTARYTELSTDYTMLVNAQQTTMSKMEIGDTVNIQKTIQTGPTTSVQFAQVCIVEGVEHYINFHSGATTKLYTTPYPVIAQFVLNSSTYGLLDGTSLLG